MTRATTAVWALALVAAACGGPEVPVLVSRPLEVTSPQSATLLAELSPADTGIGFRNVLAEGTLNRYLFRGAGVAAGDVDGDGLADLYFVGEESGNRLYRNLGNFQFEDVTSRAGLEEPEPLAGYGAGAQMADVDNDGDLDIYVTNWKASNRLYENRGDGTFEDVTASSGTGYSGGSDTPAFGDYDRDGDLDLYVTNYRPSALQYERTSLRLKRVGNRLVVPPELADRIEFVNGRLREHGETDLLFANRGDGTFEEIGAAAGIAPHGWGLAAMFADFDGDLWPDLYVTNDLWSPDRFYHNRGDGSFRLVEGRRLQYTPMFSMGLDFADINNDGAMDLIVGDMLSRDHSRRMTQHGLADEGSLSQPTGDDAPQFMRNALYLNLGNGAFEEIAWLAGVAATEWTWTTKFADLDLDGFVDLLVTNGMVRDLMDSDYTARAKELNRTADRDTVLAFLTQYPALSTANLAFRNTGRLTFDDVSDEWGFASTDVGHGLAVADLDGDGDLDLAVNNMNAPARLYRNDSATPRLAVRLVGRGSNSQGLGARLTLTTTRGVQTRDMTSSGGYLSGHEAVVVFGLGNPAAAIHALEVRWPSGNRQVFRPSDQPGLVANAAVTITEPRDRAAPSPPPPGPPATLFREAAEAAGVSFEHVDATSGDFQIQPLLPRRLSTLGPGVTLGDADGDGDDDVVVAGGRGQAPGVFINRGDGTFDSGPEGSGEPGDGMAPLWWPAGLGGAPDLLYSLSTEEAPDGPAGARYSGIVGSGGRLGPSSWSPRGPASGGALAAADVDSDGDLDLFAGGRAIPGRWPLPAPSRLFENRDGTLVDVTAERAPGLTNLGLATGATWADVDGDGDDDLLIATEWGPVRLFRNTGGQLADATAEAGLAEWTGLWNGIAAADIDGDDDLDFVATNLGANGRHRLARPPRLVIYAGDIDDAPGLDIVEGYAAGDVLYPVRERGATGKAMPFVLAAFPTFRSFATATIDEIYGRRLEGALRLEVVTFDSSLFINDGGGRFERRSLPTAAQVSTAFGVVIADLDVDGREDIYLVGNFTGNDTDSGPTGGGASAWLRGLGDGNFEAVSPARSGLFVPEEARGLAVGDLDGDLRPDLVVGVSNGPALLFRNVGHGDGHAIGMRLSGPAANPAGVGTLVTVVRGDGSRSTREITSGGGYLSQDSATVIFGLGASEAPVSITVRWPDGQITAMDDVAADQLVTLDLRRAGTP